MPYQVVSYDPKTNKTVKRYQRETVALAARLVSELTAKGLGAEFRETGHGTRGRTATPERRKGKRKGQGARRNPGELLILSGFVANPVDPQERVDARKHFYRTAPHHYSDDDAWIYAEAAVRALERIDARHDLHATKPTAKGKRAIQKEIMRAGSRAVDRAHAGVRMNPEKEADAGYEDFHQGARVDGSVEAPDHYAPNPEGEQLFLLGELVAIAYQVPASSGKAGIPFEHKFGEVGHTSRVVKANRPMLCSTADGKHLVIVHRHKPGTKKTYRVKPEGIVG